MIGYLAGYAHRTFYASGSIAWVDEIWVEPEYRGRGTGRELMDAFESWASRRGCVQAALATRGAAPFFKKIGYTSSAAYFKKRLNAVESRERIAEPELLTCNTNRMPRLTKNA